MNEPTTKEEAINLVNSILSEYDISLKDLKESKQNTSKKQSIGILSDKDLIEKILFKYYDTSTNPNFMTRYNSLNTTQKNEWHTNPPWFTFNQDLDPTQMKLKTSIFKNFYLIVNGYTPSRSCGFIYAHYWSGANQDLSNAAYQCTVIPQETQNDKMIRRVHRLSFDSKRYTGCVTDYPWQSHGNYGYTKSTNNSVMSGFFPTIRYVET